MCLVHKVVLLQFLYVFRDVQAREDERKLLAAPINLAEQVKSTGTCIYHSNCPCLFVCKYCSSAVECVYLFSREWRWGCSKQYMDEDT